MLDAALARVEKHNPKINAVVHLQVAKAKAAIKAGLPGGPFRGVPMLLKDLGAEAIDFPTNMGAEIFKDFKHRYDSEIYLRLKRAGFVTFGRTTSPAFGIGPTTEAKVYGGPTRNPWNLEHTSGGSSGGAGAAVAAGILPAAHGSDGGGSVRIPASNCGLFGFKATRARLPDGPGSGEGWAGMSIDSFLTRTVRDSAALLDATHGPDLGAPYWAPAVAWPFLEEIKVPPKPLKIAFVTKTFSGGPIDPECVKAVKLAAKLCNDLGHHVEEKAPEFDFEKVMRAWAKIVAAGTWLTVRERGKALGRDIKKSELEGVAFGATEFGKTVSGADYLQSIDLVHALGRKLAHFFIDFDILISATMAEPPAKIGRFAPTNEDFLDYRLGPNGVGAYSPYCAPFNASGQPAASLPLHWTKSGLPVGVHIAGRFGEDATVLKLSRQLEEAAPWFDKRPKL